MVARIVAVTPGRPNTNAAPLRRRSPQSAGASVAAGRKDQEVLVGTAVPSVALLLLAPLRQPLRAEKATNFEGVGAALLLHAVGCRRTLPKGTATAMVASPQWDQAPMLG